jgi:hypothetical protein
MRSLILFVNFMVLLLSSSWAGAAAPCSQTIEAIVHGLVRDEKGAIIRPVPYNGKGIIMDANVAIARGQTIDRDANHNLIYSKLRTIEKTAQKHKESFDYWVTDDTAQEVLLRRGALAGDINLVEGTRKVKVTVARQSPEYQSVMDEMKKIKIGETRGSNGEMDKKMITDLFFTETTPGAVPAFGTADLGIIRPLCQKLPDCGKAWNSGTFKTNFPDGFTVDITDASGKKRSLKIVPFLN